MTSGAEDDVAAEVAFRFQHDWKPEYEKVVRTTLAVVNDKAKAERAEWLRANFLGSASSITRPDPIQTTWNGPPLLSCARCGSTFPGGSVHHCPTMKERR